MGERVLPAPRNPIHPSDASDSARSPEELARECLAVGGAAALDDFDLLALVLRPGIGYREAARVARSMLSGAGDLVSLAVYSSDELMAHAGLGEAKAASLIAAFELGRRLVAAPLEIGARISSPEDVRQHFAPLLAEARRESFHVLLLDGRHRLMRVERISLGTLTASLVHPREVFREAIRRAAAALVLVHNHPSGDPAPSAEDRRVTRRLCDAGGLLGIPVVDHVVVATGGYFSFSESEPDFRGGRASGG